MFNSRGELLAFVLDSEQRIGCCRAGKSGDSILGLRVSRPSISTPRRPRQKMRKLVDVYLKSYFGNWSVTMRTVGYSRFQTHSAQPVTHILPTYLSDKNLPGMCKFHVASKNSLSIAWLAPTEFFPRANPGRRTKAASFRGLIFHSQALRHPITLPTVFSLVSEPCWERLACLSKPFLDVVSSSVD